MRVVNPDAGRELDPAGEQSVRDEAARAFEAGFEETVAGVRAELSTYAAASSGDPNAAEDIVQEAVALAWTRREQYRPEGNLRGWLMRMVYFKALSHRRDRARKGWLVFDEDIVQRIAEKGADMVSGQSERTEALRSCLARLKPTQRQLLAAVYVRGETIPEYAERHGLSVAGCYKAIYRLRLRLKQCIERRQGGGE